MSDTALRDQVASLLDWEEAHATLDRIVDGIPADRWAEMPPNLPYTLWQLLEHLRLSQHDILDFCRNPGYKHLNWPADYWPKTSDRPTDEEVDQSLAGFRKDRDDLKAMARDPKLDLFARIPHGTGQTYLRELLLVADHTSYHLGQMVAVRRVLGIWE